MEQENKVTADFTVQGDPNDKVSPQSQCAICGKIFSEHTMEMHKECLAKTREAKVRGSAK